MQLRNLNTIAKNCLREARNFSVKANKVIAKARNTLSALLLRTRVCDVSDVYSDCDSGGLTQRARAPAW